MPERYLIQKAVEVGHITMPWPQRHEKGDVEIALASLRNVTLWVDVAIEEPDDDYTGYFWPIDALNQFLDDHGVNEASDYRAGRWRVLELDGSGFKEYAGERPPTVEIDEVKTKGDDWDPQIPTGDKVDFNIPF